MKLRGSIGFQHMELVFVCIEERPKHGQYIHDYLDKNVERKGKTNKDFTCIITFLNGDDVRKSYSIIPRSLQKYF